MGGLVSDIDMVADRMMRLVQDDEEIVQRYVLKAIGMTEEEWSEVQEAYEGTLRYDHYWATYSLYMSTALGRVIGMNFNPQDV